MVVQVVVGVNQAEAGLLVGVGLRVEEVSWVVGVAYWMEVVQGVSAPLEGAVQVATQVATHQGVVACSKVVPQGVVPGEAEL